MADLKRLESTGGDNLEPTAPLAPNANNQSAIDASQIVIDDNRPPPPYYEPSMMTTNINNSNINAQQQSIYNNQPSTIFLTPIDYQAKLGSSPTRLRCPNCSAEILTQTRHKSGCMTWAICGSICAIGLFVPCAWLGCQFIPFCINSCKDVSHLCPNCR